MPSLGVIREILTRTPYNTKFIHFVIFCLVIALFFSISTETFGAKKKKRKPVKQNYSLTIEYDSLLSEGAVYKKIIAQKGKLRHYLHVIEADLSSEGISPIVMQSGKRAGELAKLSETTIFASQEDYHVLGAVNASFWRAYNRFPIGPTIDDGEIIELNPYKKWSSAFFDKSGRMYIDNYSIYANVRFKGIVLPIRWFNRRHDSLGLVVYNKFGGDTIPHVFNRNIDEFLKDVDYDTFFIDSTESPFNIDSLRNEIQTSIRQNSQEFRHIKVALKYLSHPLVNKAYKAVVVGLDTGLVEMPENGCILSLGFDFPSIKLPKLGDTLAIEIKTSSYSEKIFLNAVSGTPRLVRAGKAAHEAYSEGSRGRRFIGKMLPRTAIGTNKSKTTIYILCVESSSKTKGAAGLNLTQLAEIMKLIGCYDAMNLDGGGSSTMIISGKNVLRSNGNEARRIAVGIGIKKSVK